MRSRPSILILAALVAGLACTTTRNVGSVAAEAPPAPAAPLRLTLVGTNDLHGWIEPHRSTLPDGSVAEQGGLAVFAGYLAAIRADNPGGVLLLDGGDIFQGTLASNLTEGSVMVKAMNALGFEAAALGNHEFDYGPSGPASVAGPGEDPFGALKDRLAEADFPILGANVFEADSGATPGWLRNDGTKIVERHGLKIGLVGLSTPSTPRTTNPANVESLRFGSIAPSALEAATRLRAAGADVVIALVHAGARCESLADPHDVSSCDQDQSELFEFLGELPPGTLDAVIAGHTHAALGHFVHGVPVIETSGLGRSFGLIELFVDPVTRKVLPEATQLRPAQPICAWVDAASKTCDARALRQQEQVTWEAASYLKRPIVVDEAIQTMVAPALARVSEEQARRLGVEVAQQLRRDYNAESDLGNVLADGVRGAAGADVAILNSGGLRADLERGSLTFGKVYEVLPFDNTLAVVEVTTAELEKLLSIAYGSHKGVFQLSGLAVHLSACNGPDRLRKLTLPDGRPLPKRMWKVAMPDFLARGGDGLGAVLSKLPAGRIDLGERTGVGLREALIAHWLKMGRPLSAPVKGRIHFAPPPPAGCHGAEAGHR